MYKFGCKLCNKKFKNMDDYNNHFDLIYVCSVCKCTFNYMYEYIVHYFTNHCHECPYCKEPIDSDSNAYKHMCKHLGNIPRKIHHKCEFCFEIKKYTFLYEEDNNIFIVCRDCLQIKVIEKNEHCISVIYDQMFK